MCRVRPFDLLWSVSQVASQGASLRSLIGEVVMTLPSSSPALSVTVWSVDLGKHWDELLLAKVEL